MMGLSSQPSEVGLTNADNIFVVAQMPNTTTLEEKGQQLHNYHQTIMFRVLMMASLASFAEPKGNCRFSVGSRWMSLVKS
jgi:hypothetical protein